MKELANYLLQFLSFILPKIMATFTKKAITL